MADAIGPGDTIECIRAEAHFSIRIGGIYICEEIQQVPPRLTLGCRYCYQCEIQIVLVGIRPKRDFFGLIGWCPCLFRPIRRNRKFIDDLLVSTPVHELA